MDDRYLETSPNLADAGQKVGRRPASVPRRDLEALGHPTSPIRAIRAKCLDCCVQDASEVRKCRQTDCPLWPYRMGTNVFHSRAGKRSHD